MNAVADEVQPQIPAPKLPAPLLRAVVVCDLANSAQLTERLGDVESAELAQRLDRLARDLVYRYAGREIDKSDGFLLLFDRPVQAVAFALDYQRQLRELARAESLPLSARIGVHVGDVVLWENAPADVARGAKPVEVEGLAKPVAARLMSLALPGQILLSAIACTLAQRAQAELVARRAPPLWKMHGRYLFKGVAEPMRVYEVGEPGVAPLKRPAYSGKAHREVPWWRRPGMLAVEAIALAAAVALPAYLWLRSPPALAFAQRDWVVLGDLDNLTGEAAFDNSLQSAFRIDLEQSRYVNVLSDLKTRDTLALMQREPGKTRIDRAIGSEIAIRDGARALILPSVAEVGGRVRFTAEVVDPHSQTTVYTESADGLGAESVLPSMDKVDRELRLKLGEALASVSTESKPLDQVATKNLDALKAYAKAQQAYDEFRTQDALDLYRQAIRLDPGFTLAHEGAAVSLLASGKSSEAAAELKMALALKDRLIPREQLLAEAMLASIADPPKAALAKWKVLVGVYPDDFHGLSDYPYFAWILANRFDDQILKVALDAASPRNSHALVLDVLLGNLYLGNESYANAVRYYEMMEGRTAATRTVDLAATYAAQRQWEKADAALARSRSSGDADEDISAHTIEAAIAADRGDWAGAWKILQAANRQAPGVNAQRELEFRIIELSLRQLTGTGADKSALRDYIKHALAVLAKVAPENRTEIQTDILFAAYLAARKGDAAFAANAIGALGPEPRSGDYPVLTKLLAVAQAEVARAQGKPADAVKMIESTLDGSEFCLTHLALLDAYAASGDNTAALAQAKWLATHRGRAYVEYAAKVAIPYAVVNSDLALLRQAQLETALGDKNAARPALDSFSAIWPQAEQVPAFAARLKTIAASTATRARN